MNFRNNKGYTGTDLVVSIAVLIIFIPTIVSLISVISTSGGETEKKAYAISVASNVLEIAKSSDIEHMNSTDIIKDKTNANYNDFYNNLQKNYSNIQSSGTKLKWNLTDSSNNIYEVSALVEDYKDIDLNATITKNIVKRITVTVYYRANNNTKNIEISTLKTKE